MRKTFFSLVLLFLALQTTWAQQTTSTTSNNKLNKLRIGLMLGPSFTKFSIADSDVENGGSRVGFSYGLVFDYNFSDRYAISTGIIGSPGGGSYTGPIAAANDSVVTDEVKIRMRYLEIPIALKLRTNDFGKFTPYGQVGISPAFAINSRYDAKDLGIENEKANDLTKPLNVFLTVGAGTEYAIATNTRLFAGLYYNHGFMNVNDNDQIDDKIGTGNFHIRLGVYF